MLHHRARLCQQRYLKWANLQNVRTHYSQGNEIWEVFCCFSTATLLLFTLLLVPSLIVVLFSAAVTWMSFSMFPGSFLQVNGKPEMNWCDGFHMLLVTFPLARSLLIGSFKKKVNREIVLSHFIALCQSLTHTLSSFSHLAAAIYLHNGKGGREGKMMKGKEEDFQHSLPAFHKETQGGSRQEVGSLHSLCFFACPVHIVVLFLFR